MEEIQVVEMVGHKSGKKLWTKSGNRASGTELIWKKITFVFSKDTWQSKAICSAQEIEDSGSICWWVY